MRIVSLVPSHTESLHDLGLADQVVGRTRFCIAPKPWVDSVPHVGGTKDADLGKILDLAPDLVVVDKDENPLALVEDLEAQGIEVLHSEIDTVQDAADFLAELGRRCGAAPIGEAARDAILAELEHPVPDPIPVFCPIWYGPWMTFDHTAYPHAMLEAAGFHNVFAHHPGPKYFEIGADEILEAGPAKILLPTEPYPFHRRIDDLEWGPLATVPHEIIDGEALTWFGTRTLHGLRILRALHDAP